MLLFVAYLFAFVAGTCVGSFIGLLIYRLPLNQPVSTGRSKCESCHAELGVRDLVPMLSFIGLRGKCRYCGSLLRIELLSIEIAGGIIGLTAAVFFPDPALTISTALLGWMLLALGWYDARYFILPDIINLPLIPIGLAITSYENPSKVVNHLTGAVLGYVAVLGVNALYKLVRKRDGIGGGDAKLLAGAGAWLGWELLPWVIVAGSVIGITYLIVGSKIRKTELSATARVPFGACLALSIFLAYLVSNLGLFTI